MGEQGALLAADTTPDLHDDALVIVGVFRQEQKLEFPVKFLLFGLGLPESLLTELLHLRIAHQFFRVKLFLLCRQIGPVALHNGLQLVLLPQEFRRLLGIGVEIRGLRLEAQLLIAVFHRPKFFNH